MPRSSPPTAQVLPLRRDGHEDAARVALKWLDDRHRKGWANALEGLLNLWRPEDAEDEIEFDEGLTDMLTINAGEWLLARGEIFAKGSMRSINAHLLGPDGPYLTAGQQHWIAQLAERPLRLYRVTDVRVGEGLTLVDELDTDCAPLVVKERSGSKSARPGMLMGARVMHAADHLELSGSIYPFAQLREPEVIARVRAAQDAGLHPQNNQQLAELGIARCWLAQWFKPAPMPQMHDAASGDPILLVTDHYRVLDDMALRDALQAQPDVSGDAEQGWHRETAIDDGLQRGQLAINPGKARDRIEIFYRTQRLADDGRAWFEALAGTAVQHLTREITDPRSAAARASVDPDAAPQPLQDPEAMTALMEKFMHRHYANWADEPIPLLGDKTPRQAIATPAGLERVKGLLRQYESGETEMAQRDGRAPLSYEFLWNSLGIAR